MAKKQIKKASKKTAKAVKEARQGKAAKVKPPKAQAKAEGRGSGTFWFADWRVAGSKLEVHDDDAFGPARATFGPAEPARVEDNPWHPRFDPESLIPADFMTIRRGSARRLEEISSTNSHPTPTVDFAP